MTGEIPSFLNGETPGQQYNPEFARDRLVQMLDHITKLLVECWDKQERNYIYFAAIFRGFADHSIKELPRSARLARFGASIDSFTGEMPKNKSKELKEVFLSSDEPVESLYDQLLEFEAYIKKDMENYENKQKAKSARQERGKELSKGSKGD